MKRGDTVNIICADDTIVEAFVTRSYSWKWDKVEYQNGKAEYIRTSLETLKTASTDIAESESDKEI